MIAAARDCGWFVCYASCACYVYLPRQERGLGAELETFALVFNHVNGEHVSEICIDSAFLQVLFCTLEEEAAWVGRNQGKLSFGSRLAKPICQLQHARKQRVGCKPCSFA